MTYDKLKKVVNAFISTIKDEVTLVHLNVGGINQKRLLTYVGKEPSIECDTETQYKCVLTCYDNLLQQDFTFRMRDVKMYESLTDKAEKILNEIEDVQLNEVYRFIYGINYSHMWLKEQLGVDITSDHEDLDEVRDMWIDVIRKYRDSALLSLDKEREIAVDDDDQEAVDEIEMICQMLRDLPKNERDKLNKYTSVSSIMSHWPALLLPAPDFVK